MSHPHGSRILLSLALLVAVVVTGCGKKDGSPVANQAPSIRITGGPPQLADEILEASYTARIWWTGWDFDGAIDHYEYAVDPNPDLANPVFSLEEIEDPESFLDGGGLTRQILRGPEAGTDTLIYSKTVDGTRYSYTWVQTRDFTRIFTFETPHPDSVGSGGSATPNNRFSGLHTVYVRCQDNEDAYSSTDQLTYTAVTITPTSKITRPVISGDVLFVGPQIGLQWDGTDIDSPEAEKKPVGYIYKLVQLNTLNPPVRVDLAQPNFVMFQHPEASTIPWTYQSADTLRKTYFLDPPATYMFAVRAVDIAGAVEPFVDKVRGAEPGNAVSFQSQSSAGVPVLQVIEPSLGDVDGDPNGAKGLKTTEFEVPMGVALRFTWQASAEAYGGVIEGYNWGINIPDLDRDGPGSGWTGWSTLTGNLQPIVFSRPGVNTINIKVRDTGGKSTTLTVILRVIEFSYDREVLFVDDFKDETFPRDNEHDAFWLKMLTDSGRFDPATDLAPEVWKYDMHGANDVLYTFPIPPDLSLLGRYKMIFWTNRGTGYNGNSGLTLSGPIKRHLGAYVATGGRLWISGEATAAAMLPTSTGISNFEYPLEVLSGSFPYAWLKLYTSQIANDKAADLRTNGLIEVDPFPGRPVVWPKLVRDDLKVRSSLRGSGTRLCDAIFDPIFTSSEPGFRGKLDSLYVYGANGPRRVGRNSAYEGKLNGVRFHDPDPDPVHGPTIWFGFPMYYWFDDQAQVLINGIIDWFRAQDTLPTSASPGITSAGS